MDINKAIGVEYAANFQAAESGAANPRQWLIDWVSGGNQSDSGVTVNAKTSLSYAPIWFGISKIAGHIGMFPFNLMEHVDERNTRQAKSHPAYRLMKKRPNNLMNAGVFRETLAQHSLLYGNGRAAIRRDNTMRPLELIPLLPDRTITVLMDGEKWHVVDLSGTEETPFDPDTPESKVRIPDQDVLHITGMSFDGVSGYKLYDMAKNSFGSGLAGEKHTNSHFKNNARPGFLLEAPPGVLRTEDEAREFLANFNQYHQGVDNSNRAGLLREGIKAATLGMSGRDGQWVEQRIFSRQEAALWLGLESILGDDSSVSYNSLEAKNQSYLSDCLNRWLKKWEEECDEKLLGEVAKRRGTHFFRFKTAALLRGTTKERYETYAIGIQNRILSPNECRHLEDLNSYDGGDEFFNPAITPGDGEDSGDGSASARAMVASNVRNTIDIEVKRVIAASEKEWGHSSNGKKLNFVSWLDMFYDGWTATMSKALNDDGLAAFYVEESKRRLLELAGQAEDKKQLASLVKLECKSWPDRAGELLDNLIPG